MAELQKFETLELKLDDNQVLTVVINRPQVLNALNEQVLMELESVFTKLVAELKPRAILLSGAGEKAFVAGADIAQMSELDEKAAVRFSELGQRVTRAMEALKQPIVARVQGFALGGGCELAMACDIIVASHKAKFGQPEVNLGLIAGFGGTQRLVRRVGIPVAMDMLCAGRNIGGEEAAALGLVSRSVAPEELDAEVSKVVKGILKAAPGAIGESKRLAREAYNLDLDAGLNSERVAFGKCFSAGEGKEGMKAFLEKRSASFSR